MRRIFFLGALAGGLALVRRLMRRSDLAPDAEPWAPADEPPAPAPAEAPEPDVPADAEAQPGEERPADWVQIDQVFEEDPPARET